MRQLHHRARRPDVERRPGSQRQAEMAGAIRDLRCQHLLIPGVHGLKVEEMLGEGGNSQEEYSGLEEKINTYFALPDSR